MRKTLQQNTLNAGVLRRTGLSMKIIPFCPPFCLCKDRSDQMGIAVFI